MTTPSSPYSSPLGGGPGTPPVGPPAPAGKSGRGGKEHRKPTRRLLSQHRKGALVMAVVAALLFLLVRAGSVTKATFVVVARTPVAALTPVTDSQLAAVKVEPKLLVKGAYTGPSASAALKRAHDALTLATGSDAKKITLYPIAANQQLTADDFSQPASTPLADDERLVSVSAQVSTAVGGTLQAGDHVTVIAALNNMPGAEGAAAGVVVPDAQIVAIAPGQEQVNSAASEQTNGSGKNKAPSDLLPGTPIPGIYTLKVKDNQVLPLTAADGTSGGKLYLVYHTPGSQSSATAPVDALTALCGNSGAGSPLAQFCAQTARH